MKSDTEWTVNTLKQHMDVRFEDAKEAIRKASEVAEQRAARLETTTQARFESVNEFRAQTKDLQATYMPRSEFDAALKSVNEKIQAKNLQVVMSLGVGFVAVLIAVFNFANSLG
jgi:uncharacterized protein YggE